MSKLSYNPWKKALLNSEQTTHTVIGCKRGCDVLCYDV